MISYRCFQLAHSKDLFVSGSLMNRLVPCLFTIIALLRQCLPRLNVMLKENQVFVYAIFFLIAFSLPVQIVLFLFLFLSDVHHIPA